jgi:hypothetical protein
VALQVPDESGPPVDCVERFEHFCIPAGNRCIIIANGIKKIGYNRGLDAGHIARGNEDKVALRSLRPCVKAAYGTDPRADIRNTSDTAHFPKASALVRVAGNKDDLTDHFLQRIYQALDKCPAPKCEKIFLLPVCPPGLSPDKDDCRPQDGSPRPASDSRNCIRSTMQEL